MRWLSDDVKTTQEAFDVIRQDYYRKVKTSTLVNSGISGAVDSLHDRFSTYLDPTAYKRFLEQSSGRFSGIGTEGRPRQGRVCGSRACSRAPPPPRPAIKVGDRIVAVGGTSIAGKPVQQTTSLIRGRPGDLRADHGSSAASPRRVARCASPALRSRRRR